MCAAALEQKLARWKAVRHEVDEGLLTRVAQFTNDDIQLWALAFGYSCGSTLERMLFADGSVAQHLRQNIHALTPDGLRYIYASLTAAWATTQHGADDPARLERVLQLTEILYGQPATFSSRWLEFAAANRGHDAFAGRLVYRLNDEICPVLQLETKSVGSALAWTPILAEVQAFADDMLKHDKWREACRIDLKVVARSQPGSSKPASGCAVMAVVVCSLIVALVNIVGGRFGMW